MTSYVRPAYPALKARIETDLAALPAVLHGSLSAMWARSCYAQHGHLDWIDRQCSPLTCELERLYDWAALYNVDRLAATAATGNVLATGAAGTLVLADTVFRGQNGVDYKAVAAVTLGAGATPIAVRCQSAGRIGNLAAGQTLSVVDPIPGLSGSLTVDSAGLTGGAEQESLENWRVRLSDEWRAMVDRGGRGGKPEDYRFWARSAHPDVTEALIQLHAFGVGTVTVRPICNRLDNRMPTQAVLDAVAIYIGDRSPGGALVSVTYPIIAPVVVMIDLLAEVDSDATRGAITAALQSLVLAESGNHAFLGMAEIDAAIATVTQSYTRLAPLVDLQAGPGEMFVLNPIVWA